MASAKPDTVAYKDLPRERPIRDLTQRAAALRETRNPIRNLRARLELSDEDWDRLDGEAKQVVEAAVAFAKAGTEPRPEDALLNVYAEQRGE